MSHNLLSIQVVVHIIDATTKRSGVTLGNAVAGQGAAGILPTGEMGISIGWIREASRRRRTEEETDRWDLSGGRKTP